MKIDIKKFLSENWFKIIISICIIFLTVNLIRLINYEIPDQGVTARF